MEIPLVLTSHCIETEIKRLYEQAVRRYFKPDADTAELEKTIDFLKTVLEHFDFRGLRTRYPALCGHTNARVVLFADAEGRAGIRINDFAVE